MAEITIAHLTEAVQFEGQESEKRDNKQIGELASLNKSFAQYFKSMAADKLDKLEEKREAVSGKKPTGEEFSKAGQGFKDALDFGVLGFVGAIGAALSGLVVGVTIGFGKYLSALAKTFDNLTGNRISKQMLKVGRSIRSGLYGLIGLMPNGKPGPAVGKVIAFFSKIKNPFNTSFKLFDSLTGGMYKVLGLGVDGKPVTGTSNFVKRLYKIGNIFKPLTSLFGEGFKGVGSSLKSVSDAIKGGISRFTSVFQTIGKTFSSLRGALSPIFTVFKTLGRVIFAPLTLILAIVDGIKGAIAGFQEEGILGGILGAVGGVLGGLVGMPLDLLKSAIGWIAGKLGFENFQEMLSGFSFQDGIMDIFMKIAEVFNNAISFVTDSVGAIGKKVANFFGFGGDEEEEPETKTITNGRVQRLKNRQQQLTSDPSQRKAQQMAQDAKDNARQLKESGYVPLAERSTEEKASYFNQQEERFKAQIKRNQDRLAAMTPEERAKDADGFGSSTRRIEDLQRKIAELDQGRKDLNVPIVDASTTNTTNSSNQAVYGDASPATDDLDRVA